MLQWGNVQLKQRLKQHLGARPDCFRAGPFLGAMASTIQSGHKNHTNGAGFAEIHTLMPNPRWIIAWWSNPAPMRLTRW